MTLDEYRLQVFERLKACAEAAPVREFLAGSTLAQGQRFLVPEAQ